MAVLTIIQAESPVLKPDILDLSLELFRRTHDREKCSLALSFAPQRRGKLDIPRLGQILTDMPFC